MSQILRPGGELRFEVDLPKGAPLDDVNISVECICSGCERVHTIATGIAGGQVRIDCVCGRWYSFEVGPVRVDR